MPVHYDIFPHLNLVLYICTGVVTPTEFFQVGDEVANDARLKEKMKIIIDFFSADLNISVADLHLAIQKYRESKLRGQEVGQTAVLTTNRALRNLGDTLSVLSLDPITNFGIFFIKQDLIRWLDLPEEAVLQCWTETKRKASRTF